MENAARKRQVFLRADEQQVFNQLAVVPAVYGARGEDLRGFQKQHGAVFCGGDIDEHRFIRHTGIGLCKDLPGTDFIENTAVAENVVAFNRHTAREHDAERVCMLARVADEIALFIAARFRF